MNAHAVEFHPEALYEAQAAVEWYQERSVRAAEAFLNELESAIYRILDAPQRWPLYESGTRRLRLHRFPYFVVYREAAQTVQVLAIAHARRRPGYWRSRAQK
jgi:plasmid stabilization system protein ParE